MRIDARGLGCPEPVVLAEQAIGRTGEGAVEVLVDNEASVRNLERFARKNGLYSETETVDGCWKVKITRGRSCPEDAAGSEGRKGGVMMVIGTDSLGKDEALGRMLMKGFLETMKVTRELPDMIFFLNAGVRLTTRDEEVVPLLKEMESLGVEVFSCGTCLKHYGLEAELKVGYRGSTGQIVEGLREFGKVVWI